jgi:hypothetical protein
VCVSFLRETITDPSESTWSAETSVERPDDVRCLWDNPARQTSRRQKLTIQKMLCTLRLMIQGGFWPILYEPYKPATQQNDLFLNCVSTDCFNLVAEISKDRLCGVVVRVLPCRSRGPRFDSRRYQIFWEVVGLERGLLSLIRIIEELFQGNSGSGLENRD